MVAIAVQGVWASVIALSGRYEQILNYVVALDAVFFGLTGAALLVFRRRDPRPPGGFRMPGHPWTTIVFVAAFWALAVNTVIHNPRSAGIGVLILLAGVPAYFFWRRGRDRRRCAPRDDRCVYRQRRLVSRRVMRAAPLLRAEFGRRHCRRVHLHAADLLRLTRPLTSLELPVNELLAVEEDRRRAALLVAAHADLHVVRVVCRES